MTPEEHRAALRALAAERKKIAESEPAAVLAALRAGVRQTEIARDLERTREHIRRLTRAAEDVEAE